MKIVINKCFGGFSVTEAVHVEFGFEWDSYGYPDNKNFNIDSDNPYAYRANPKLIAAIEKVGIETIHEEHRWR